MRFNCIFECMCLESLNESLQLLFLASCQCFSGYIADTNAAMIIDKMIVDKILVYFLCRIYELKVRFGIHVLLH